MGRTEKQLGERDRRQSNPGKYLAVISSRGARWSSLAFSSPDPLAPSPFPSPILFISGWALAYLGQLALTYLDLAGITVVVSDYRQNNATRAKNGTKKKFTKHTTSGDRSDTPWNQQLMRVITDKIGLEIFFKQNQFKLFFLKKNQNLINKSIWKKSNLVWFCFNQKSNQTEWEVHFSLHELNCPF